MTHRPAATPWDLISTELEKFERAIHRSHAVNVNAARLRGDARQIALRYFREARDAVRPTVTQATGDGLDSQFQDLLRLATRPNAKTSYVRVLSTLRELRLAVETESVLQMQQPVSGLLLLTETEDAIQRTIDGLVPNAGQSYRQALIDLAGPDRGSWRGPAVDLREALREVLDHVAPDDVVLKSGVKLEAGRSAPTMAQKVSFILRSRGLASGSIGAPKETADAIDAIVGSLARATYNRGSVVTHTTGTRQEIRQLKRYVDAVLCDVLAIS